MSFDDILKKIKEDAEEEASRMMLEAKVRAGGIIEEAEKEASEKSRKDLLRAEAETEEERRRIMALERLEARRSLLMAKQEAVDEVYAKVLVSLHNLSDDEYLGFVRRSVMETVETGEETLLISPNDRERITPEFLGQLNSELEKRGLPGSLKMEVVDSDLDGGVMLRGEGTEVNLTFAQILESIKEEVEPDIIAILFPEEEESGS
jgi:V/A-type H+-transporting ATPase subunit E